MRSIIPSLSLSLLNLFSAASAQRSLYQPCPLLGPFVPAPPIDSASPALKAVAQSVNKLLDDYIVKGDGRFGPISPNTTSFSLALFAGSNFVTGPDDLPFFYEYHHAARDSNDNSLDKDSVFALGDLTQVFTVYTQLAELGDEVWSRSIVDYVPELVLNFNVSSGASDTLTRVQWKEVTLGALAGHMSGIARDCKAPRLSFDVLVCFHADPQTADTCKIDKTCNKDAFLSALIGKLPINLPDTTPLRSNAAFELLALAVESATGELFESTFNNRLATPLSLENTHFLKPQAQLFGKSLSNKTLEGEQASVGLTSTISDLAKLGRAILTSAVLLAATTRRWLKPFTSTSNLRNAVGRPWEIYHFGNLPTDPIIDVYTKTGSVGRYSSYFGLVPSYDVGFAILAVDSGVEAPDLNAYADITLGEYTSFYRVVTAD